MSVELSAENVLFAHVFYAGFIRLIEMLLVCLWGSFFAKNVIFARVFGESLYA